MENRDTPMRTPRRRAAMTLRQALLLTTLVALIPALGVIVLMSVEHSRALERSVRTEAHRAVEAVAQIHEETVVSIRRLLETVAALPAFRESDHVHQGEILRVLLEANPQLVNISATDTNGRVLVSPGLATGTDLSDRKHIRDAIALGRFVAGEFVLARVDSKPAFPYAVPIRDHDNAIVGVLAVVYELSSYAQVFDRFDLPEQTVLGIADHRGIRLYYRPMRETTPIGSPIGERAFRQMESDGEIGTIEDTGHDGITRYYAYRRLSVPDSDQPYLYIAFGFPESLVTMPVHAMMVRNTVLLLVAIALAAVVAKLLGDAALGRRFDMLLATARAISLGDLSARTGIAYDRSEISRIGRAIDRMASQLEARLAERTREQARIEASLREKEVLLREIHHRVKNNMQLILSIAHLQKDIRASVDDFCDDLDGRIGAMATVHEMLYESPSISTVPMQDFLERLTTVVTYRGQPPRVSVRADAIELDLETAIPVALIAAELMANAGKHGTGGDQPVSIDIGLRSTGRFIELVVQDTGPGFPTGFQINTQEGLGMRLVDALASQLKGTMHPGGRVDGRSGARVVVTIPGTPSPEA